MDFNEIDWAFHVITDDLGATNKGKCILGGVECLGVDGGGEDDGSIGDVDVIKTKKKKGNKKGKFESMVP